MEINTPLACCSAAKQTHCLHELVFSFYLQIQSTHLRPRYFSTASQIAKPHVKPIVVATWHQTHWLSYQCSYTVEESTGQTSALYVVSFRLTCYSDYFTACSQVCCYICLLKMKKT